MYCIGIRRYIMNIMYEYHYLHIPSAMVTNWMQNASAYYLYCYTMETRTTFTSFGKLL